MSQAKQRWVLVQHSGWVIGGEPSFQQAVEPRVARDAKTIALIEKAGGLLFDDYIEAEDAAEAENYQSDNASLIPQAPGEFNLAVTIDGLPLYTPKLREYVVTYTSMTIEAHSSAEAIDKAGDSGGGGNWEAELVDKQPKPTDAGAVYDAVRRCIENMGGFIDDYADERLTDACDHIAARNAS